jgi:hypothetical protein
MGLDSRQSGRVAENITGRRPTTEFLAIRAEDIL